MRTSIFKPAVCQQGATFPGLLVYSEIYQVTGPIERVCRRLASEGYVVVAGDCYHEFATGPLGYTDEGTVKGNALKTTKPLKAFDSDTIATVDYLLSLPDCNGKIGAFGLCLGGMQIRMPMTFLLLHPPGLNLTVICIGGLAFRAATVSPHIRAAACHFPTDIHNRGLGPQGAALPPGTRHSIDSIDSIRGEVLMVWGTQDPHIPVEGRTVVRDALIKEGATYTWSELNANHAFLRDECSKGRYDGAISAIAWAMTFELFQRRLVFGLLFDGLTSIKGPL